VANPDQGMEQPNAIDGNCSSPVSGGLDAFQLDFIGRLVPRGTVGQELPPANYRRRTLYVGAHAADKSKQPAAEFTKRCLEQKKTRRVEPNRENTKEVDVDLPVSEVDYGGSAGESVFQHWA